jgi:hypothetical protein
MVDLTNSDKFNHDLIHQQLVFVAAEMGIGIVQEVAAETLKLKPGTSLKEFTKILDEYLEKQKAMTNEDILQRFTK